MAVAFDAVGPSSAGAGTSGTATATSASWSHTCSGSNRLVVAGVAIGANNSAAITTTATFGGTSMTSLGSISSDNQNVGYVQMFYLLNPSTGASTVALTLTGGAATICAGSISFTGAGGVGTAVTAAGATSPSVTVTGTTAGNMVVDTACTGTSFTSSNQTSRWLKNTDNNTAAGNGAGSTAAAGGSITMSYTVSSDWSGIVAVEIQASAPPVVNPRPIAISSQAVMRASSL